MNDFSSLVTWPAPSGPHAVGRVSFEVIDSDRVEQLAPDPKLGRRVHVYAWYPTSEIGIATERLPYFSASEASVLPAAFNAMLQRPQDYWSSAARLRTNS